MESKVKYLYLIDYWVPGSDGIINLIAESDQEAISILSNEESFDSEYNHLIVESIIKAEKLKLADEYCSGIINAFVG